MQQISIGEDKTWLGGEGDPLRIVQEILVWSYYQE